MMTIASISFSSFCQYYKFTKDYTEEEQWLIFSVLLFVDGNEIVVVDKL